MSTCSDIYAFTARASLLLQLMTVFPLLLLIIRSQVFGLLYKTAYPSFWHVSGLNAALMAVTFAFAALNLQISIVLRFTGAIGGLIIVVLIPVAIDHLARKRAGTATIGWYVVHALIAAVGLAVFVLQFVS